MVRLDEIVRSNAQSASKSQAGVVCVFSGATGGIGAATLNRLSGILRNSTFYVLGRSASRFQSQRAVLEAHRRGNKIVFLGTEVTLLSQVDATCKAIVEKEQKVDVLYMSAGMLPFNGPACLSPYGIASH